RFQTFAKIDNLRVVSVKARDREMGLRLFRFFFEADDATVAIELDYAVALRVAHLIPENARALFDGERFAKEIEFSVKDVVAQNQARTRVADKFRANQKCFGDSAWFRLLGILNFNSQLRAIA